MSTRARRLVALEARLRQVDGDELRELLRVMSYGELLALEAAVVPHGDVAPALQAGDEVTIALITAARARRQGHHVAPLFNEPARRYVRTPHPTSPHDRASLAQLAEIGSAEEDDLLTLGQAIATARPDRVSSNLPCAPGPRPSGSCSGPSGSCETRTEESWGAGDARTLGRASPVDLGRSPCGSRFFVGRAGKRAMALARQADDRCPQTDRGSAVTDTREVELKRPRRGDDWAGLQAAQLPGRLRFQIRRPSCTAYWGHSGETSPSRSTYSPQCGRLSGVP